MSARSRRPRSSGSSVTREFAGKGPGMGEVAGRVGRAATLALVIAALAPQAARAAAISPLAWEAARGTSQEAALRERQARYVESHKAGVDRVYTQFALNLAKYPRGGVAHRNILVVLCDFPPEGVNPGLHPAKESTPAYYQRLFFSDDPNDGLISLREFYK